MEDEYKAREQLINELTELRRRITELEALETERKQTEEILQESEQKYRSLFENMLNGFAYCKMLFDENSQPVDFVYLEINDAFETLTGLRREDVIGRKVTEAIPGTKESHPELFSIYGKVALTGEPTKFDVYFKPLGIWLNISVYSPQKEYFVAVFDNITERKQAEDTLEKSERNFRTSLDSSPLGVRIVTAEGELLYANQAVLDIYGYSSFEELKNTPTKQRYTHESYAEHRRRAEDRKLGKPVSNNYEIGIIRKDGEVRYLQVFRRGVIWNGETQFQSIYQDITERKQAEEERQKLAKLESVGTLAGGIAHDFNNLLTGIMGNIGLAKRHIEPGSKAEERLSEAEKASYRARDLTQQLLTFSRGGAPVKKIIFITGLIKESATFALRGSKVRPEFSLPDDLWAVEIDEGQMSQVIRNTVINADEAMPNGGILNIGAKNTTITVRGTLPLPKGNYIKISIEDQGVGISKEHLQRIFEPYFTTKQKGSGLGLATTFSIIKNHGGHITVESELNVGTTFHIYLPASKKPIAKKKEKAVQAAFAGRGRILVMDDEEMIREMISNMLSAAGYEVELTSDGAEAVEQYTKAKEAGQPFDAVILDLTIPGGMGGKESIKKLLEIDPDAKVIVSSGYATDPIMADYEKYGFSAVVTKPYSVAQIEKTLHNLLRKKK